ncbi:MAG: hypothetical protein M1834_009223 [Cirrosporium novae-zelandiae]|nr:MAG: hypothetical protein M1834_009223 [Cirrosporium novae-zelandiae]
MAKSKNKKTTPSAPQKHLYSRISYLYQTAILLNSVQTGRNRLESETNKESQYQSSKSTDTIRNNESGGLGNAPNLHEENREESLQNPITQRSTRRLLSQARAISMKSQIRLSPNIKRTICKRCDALLIPGQSSAEYIENISRDRKKPWADILVIQCQLCGTSKRFPVGASKQTRRTDRTSGTAMTTTESQLATRGNKMEVEI